MSLTSLDPRINRLNIPDGWPDERVKKELDQLITYEVFLQKRKDSPFTYVGPVHAPDVEVAFLYAKEQYSRRATCFGLWVAKTQDIHLTPYGPDDASILEAINLPIMATATKAPEAFEIFVLKKRGKAHTHAGAVMAADYESALEQAQVQYADVVPCVNVWLVPEAKIFKSTEADKEMWLTLADKKYREPVAYKVLDKIKDFKNQTATNP